MQLFEPVSVREWIDVVRRARLGKPVKAIAHAVAIYADFDTGLNVRPGVAKLAHEAEYSYDVTTAALVTLCELGLLAKTGKFGNTDLYRLTLPDFGVFKVPDPAQHELAIQRIRDRQRGSYKGGVRGAKSGLPLVGTGADAQDDPICPGPDGGQVPESAPDMTLTDSGSAPGSSPICPYYEPGLPIDHERTTSHSGQDLIADVTVPGTAGRDGEPENEFPSEADSPLPPVADLVTRPRCPHGRSPRNNSDGTPRCPDCATEQAAQSAAEAVNRPAPVTHCEHGLKIAHRTDGQRTCFACRRGLPGRESIA